MHHSRRQFIKLGALGAMVNLPHLLWARSPYGAASPPKASALSCILIFMEGGPSQLDIWDMKPNAPAEIRGLYRPLATSVAGIQVCELLPRLAKLADRYCLIRSLTHKETEHHSAVPVVLSGHSKRTEDAPYIGSILSKIRPSTDTVPSYVWLQDTRARSYSSGGFLGPAAAPLCVGKDVNNGKILEPNFRVTAFDTPEGSAADHFARRRGLLGELNAAQKPLAGDGNRFHQLQERAFDLLTSPEARRAFDLHSEPTKVRDQYGRHLLGQNLLMARRLIEAGVRLVGLNAFAGVAPGYKPLESFTWDMHGMTSATVDPGIYGTGTYGLGWALPCLDQAVSALLEDLELRGLLKTTLVVLVGEYGRSPRLDTSPGVPGRNHWPFCYSGALAGGGIRGGTVYGASDKHAAYVKDAPVSPEDFAATLLHALGVEPETRLSPDGFSRPASTGRPIEELFA